MGASVPNSSRRMGPRTVLMVAFTVFPTYAGITMPRTTRSYHPIGLGVGATRPHLDQTGIAFPAARSRGSAGTGVRASWACHVALRELLSRFHSVPTYCIAASLASFAESRLA